MDWPTFFHYRWTGPWATPNIAAAALVQFAVILPALVLISARRNFSQTVILPATLIALTVCGFFIVSTGSRGGVIALIGGIIWWIWWSTNTAIDRPFLYKCCIALVAGLLIGILYCPPATRILGGYQNSGQTRFSLWGAAIIMSVDHPLWGIGDFGAAFNRWYAPSDMMRDRWPMTINDPLQVASNYGLIAFGIFNGVIVSSILVAVKLSRSSFQSTGPIWHALGGVLLVAYIASIFSNLIWRPLCLIPAIAALILLLVYSQRTRCIQPLLFGAVFGAFSSLLLSLIAICILWGGHMPPLVESISGIDSAKPRKGAVGKIAIIGGPEDDLDSLSRGPGRFLVSLGWAVEVATLPNAERLTGPFSGLLLYGGGARAHISENITVPVIIIDPHMGPRTPLGRTTLFIGRVDRLPAISPTNECSPFPKARCWPKDFPLIANRVDSYFRQHGLITE